MKGESMKTLMILIALTFNLEPATAKNEPARNTFASHRLIAYVLSDESQKTALEQAAQQWDWEIADRDIMMVNLGEIEIETKHSFPLSAADKQVWRNMLKLGLDENRFVLVGKDGGAKAFQKDELNWQLFFDLIDQMPMRRAEMEANYHAAMNARSDS